MTKFEFRIFPWFKTGFALSLCSGLLAGCGADPKSGREARPHAAGQIVHAWHGMYLEVDAEARPHAAVSSPRIFKTDDPFKMASGGGEEMILLVPHGLLDPAVFDRFVDELQVKVSLISYADDRELMQFIQEGAADLALVQSFFVPKFMEMGLLGRLGQNEKEAIQRIVWTPPVGRRFHTHIPEEILAYSVPYLWSSLGIAYNQKYFPDGIRGWQELMMPKTLPQEIQERIKGRVSIIPARMDNYASALLALGHAPNSSDSNLVGEAGLVLQEQQAFLNGRMKWRALQSALADESVVLAQATGADALAARQRNANIRFKVPEEGTHIYMASLVLPVKSNRRVLGERLFEYLLDPRVSGPIANSTRLASVDFRARAYASIELLGGQTYELPRQFYQLQSVADWAVYDTKTNLLPVRGIEDQLPVP